MRLTKVEITGYKRLASASCNLDGRLIALLGPNEAGKSSVLEALAWLSDEDEEALEGPKRSRSLPDRSGTAEVVRARFAVEPDDLATLSDLDADAVPRTFILVKLLDGTFRTNVEPQLNRSRGFLDVALTVVERFEKQHAKLLGDDNEHGPALALDALRVTLAQHDDERRQDASEPITELTAWCHEVAADEGTPPKTVAAVEAFAATLGDVQNRLAEDPPHTRARLLLRDRVPEFLLFDEEDRVLETEYNLADKNLLADVPPALENLLALGDTTLDAIRQVQVSRDVTRIKTMRKDVNAQLAERLQPTWRQSQLTVSIDINGDMLQVLIDEATGATTAIAERSDGLKTFIALVCFLARHHSDVPPVLMLDEAETHLHYDAQADLIDVLLHHVETSKVIYTTHSPGCLPPDLGTGIRLVAPTPDRAASVLRNDFWSSNEPGFSPLLFAMGAGAAAFSVCRRAVLAEGPSDMILLPTLLRLATGATDIGYQVAPGLSSVRPSELVSDSVAARVTYLVDGDAAGDTYRADLVASGVTDKHIFSLPNGCAIEDLLTPDCYVSVVQALLADAGYQGTPVTAQALEGSGIIAARLKVWCATHKVSPPGKTAVASRLVQDPGSIKLTAEGKKALVALHKGLTKVLTQTSGVAP